MTMMFYFLTNTENGKLIIKDTGHKKDKLEARNHDYQARFWKIVGTRVGSTEYERLMKKCKAQLPKNSAE